MCHGPLLFDLAVCIVGNCFDENNELSMEYLQALLEGYHRVLSPQERSMFVGFMRHALLCNATWRFVNFNLTHPHLRRYDDDDDDDDDGDGDDDDDDGGDDDDGDDVAIPLLHTPQYITLPALP